MWEGSGEGLFQVMDGLLLVVPFALWKVSQQVIWPLPIRALIPFMKTPPSGSKYFLKAPTPNTLTMRLEFQHMNSGGTSTFSTLCTLKLDDLILRYLVI